MEDLISDGYIAGCLDMTTTELADTKSAMAYSTQGRTAAQAAPRAGVSPPSSCRAVLIWPTSAASKPCPTHYRQRNLYQWNPEVTLLRTNEEPRTGSMGADAGHRRQRWPPPRQSVLC
ncbi:hypothetical protein [Achromobacter marplatensis]|uniref:hypothetical protein n=1 Tax=Achromobacter marplatensis TaxID=470868 RepID=UPI003C7515B3